jgi:hypothetical protein
MKSRLRAFVVAGLVAAGSLTAVVAATLPAHADTQICDQYGTTTIQGRYAVQNNRWGTSNTQCITVNNTGFVLTTSNANNATNGAPAAYPSIFYGCHYANCTPGTILPLAASDARFGKINTSVGMSYPSSGVWDAAYDIWFDPTPRKDGQNTGSEIMVWLNHQGSIQPVGSKVATAVIAGATWDVWFGNTGWNVVSYVRTSATGSMSFAPAAFFNDSVSRGYGQRSWYLTSIQAGFEPWVGGAGLAVTSFSVTTDGSGGGGGSPTISPPVTLSPPTTGPPTTSHPPTTSSPPPTGGGSSSCQVAYTANSWSTGFTADVKVTNSGSSAINGWALTWSWAGNQQISSAWNATVTSSGSSVTARNLSWNGAIAPGGSAAFGIQGTYTGSNAKPGSFALNGVTCSS